MLKFLDKTAFSGFVVMGIAGILSAYPETEAQLRSVLHPEVVETLDLVRSEDFCVLNAVSQHYQIDWTRLLRIGSDRLLDYGPVRQVAQRESLLGNSTVALTTPNTFLLHKPFHKSCILLFVQCMPWNSHFVEGQL